MIKKRELEKWEKEMEEKKKEEEKKRKKKMKVDSAGIKNLPRFKDKEF